jgi:nucleotide-binding universal stress UspA family protein
MTIVLGYVPTPEGRAALHQGIKEAKLRGAPLLVINSSKGGDYLDAATLSAEEQALDSVRAQLKDENVEHEVRRLVRGREPAEELVDVATETNADLIVIGMHRRTALGKLIMGSTAERVLHDAPCPVLAVKASNGEV